MATHPLIQYIEDSHKKNQTTPQILRALVDAGWRVHEVVDVLLEHGKAQIGVSDVDVAKRENIAVIHGLSKSYGIVKALDNVSLEIKRGQVTALLGPNGAGKTTLVRALTTLLTPDAGQAVVAGFDVIRQAHALRSVIGLAGQYAAVDEILSGRENLEMVGRLYHLSPAKSKQRAEELLKQFGIEEAADRPVRTYSGGMRRRLDLAASLVIKPQLLFLDEPTTGLDPRGRFELWHIIRELVADGTTVMLTTQYLEEADQLADQIFVIDHGRIIAKGSPDALKRQIGGDVLELHLVEMADLEQATELVNHLGQEQPRINYDTGVITLPIDGGATILADVIRQLDGAQIKIRDVSLRRPSLDDVFLKLTGHSAEAN